MKSAQYNKSKSPHLLAACGGFLLAVRNFMFTPINIFWFIYLSTFMFVSVKKIIRPDTEKETAIGCIAFLVMRFIVYPVIIWYSIKFMFWLTTH